VFRNVSVGTPSPVSSLLFIATGCTSCTSEICHAFVFVHAYMSLCIDTTNSLFYLYDYELT